LVLAEFLMLLVAYPMALQATRDSFSAFMHGAWKSLRSVFLLLRA
jgi:hypothetical protein